MTEITEAIDFMLNDTIYKLTLSNLMAKEYKFKKINIIKKQKNYQIEKYTKTQVFHETVEAQDLHEFLLSMIGVNFKQCNAWNEKHEYIIEITKKGKVFYSKRENHQEPIQIESHNRQKNYILPQDACIEPLIDMGILTKEGKVVNSMYDKYKQINRFIEIIDDKIRDFKSKEITVIDIGCGKSYLTFILYYYLSKIKMLEVKMVGIDLKGEVVEKCNLASQKYGYEGLSFEVGDIKEYACDFSVDMVISLHACDIATDYVLFNAIKWDASMIFSVPCCQHEVNSQIKSDIFTILTKHGIIKERLSSLMTDAIRANILEYYGYKTQLLEFVDFDHTPKNILIRATKSNTSDEQKEIKLKEIQALTEEFNIMPTLFKLMLEK